MKTSKLLLPLLIVFSAFAMYSCEEEGGGGMGAGTMSAKVDGTDWGADIATVASRATDATGSEIVTVTGSSADGTQMQVLVTNYTGPGTYEFGGLTNASTGRWTEDITPTGTFTTFALAAGIGSVTITDDSGDNVQGTFEFDCNNTSFETRSVTEGSFNADVQ